MNDAKTQTESFLDFITADFEIARGSPAPLGPTLLRGGINFAVFSKHATSVTLVLWKLHQEEPLAEFPLDPRYNRTGDIWHVFVRGLDSGLTYGYRIQKFPNPNPALHRYNPDIVLLDPYAKAFTGGTPCEYEVLSPTTHPETKPNQPRRSLIIGDDFDWGFDQPLNIPLSESILYELDVQGFTAHASSQSSAPGTFAGLIEKIPYLQSLGITAVALLPINECEQDETRMYPISGQSIKSSRKYHSIGFFAPNASYAHCSSIGGQVKEFKQLVKSFHEAGIEIILDVVFNHTAEGDERGPTISFRGIDNTVYYMLEGTAGTYANYSGCGNTLNCNHPVVRSMLLDCLRYWVTEMHVDGFRFDLASILGRGQDGMVLTSPPLLESIAADPILGHTKLIAEAWDAAGLYQVGRFPSWGRWAEWNSQYRDDIHGFMKGSSGMVRQFATRLYGSADLYQTSYRQPFHSINFVTSHDGPTLADLVSYNSPYTELHEEAPSDSCKNNMSEDHDDNKPCDDPSTLKFPGRQMKNFATVLFLSQGVPMILAGDEFGRTQRENNDRSWQGHERSVVNWGLLQNNADLFRFFTLLIQFRKIHPHLRKTSYIPTEDSPEGGPITWHGTKQQQPNWSHESRSLGMVIHGGSQQPDIFMIANAHPFPQQWELPTLPPGRKWGRVVDTMLTSPFDISMPGQELLFDDTSLYPVGESSVVVFIHKCGE